MKKTAFLLLVSLLLAFQLAFAQWSSLALPANHYVTALDFLTDDLGYSILLNTSNSVQTLQKSTDGGQSWTPIGLPIQGHEFQAVDFTADGVGVAVFRDLGNTVTPTVVYKTSDDGANWTDITPDTTAAGMGTAACKFLDANTGYFGTDAQLYKTTDGGSTWTNWTFNGYPMSMDFVDANHGTVGLFDGTFNYFGGMASTSDGGATWQTTWLTDNGTVIGEVIQLDAQTALAAPVKFGAYQQTRFFKTQDNGLTWDTIAVPDTLPDGALSEIDFLDAMEGVVSVTSFDRTLLYRTLDGGLTWALEDTLGYFAPSDLQLTAQTGYFAGDIGHLYKLTGPLGTTLPVSYAPSVWPNPIQAGARLHWRAEGYIELHVIDMRGQQVFTQRLASTEVTLPELPRGLYFARFLNEQGWQTTKLRVE